MYLKFLRYFYIVAIGFVLLLYSSCVRYEEFPLGKVQSCDCELLTRDGKKFIGLDTTMPFFEGGKLQSDVYSKTGKYSVLTTPKEKYALGYSIKNTQPFMYFKISVWRYSKDGKGVLVAASDRSKGLYVASDYAIEKDQNGWEKLELDVFIPYNFVNRDIKIYVWNNGDGDIYFDDLRIQRLANKEYPVYNLSPLRIQIDTTKYLKLERKRQTAFEDGILQSNDNDWIKGIIFADTNILQAKLRLKGDWLDHLAGDKWSFRIKLRKSYSWNRLRTFSIQTPAARGFMKEWVAHKIFESQDILTTRYGFVPVYLNNSSKGLYAWEEHFQKQLLESRNRREGPIIKFSEDGFWQTVKLQVKYNYKSKLPYYNASLIEPFGLGKTLSNPTLHKEFLIAQRLMKQYKDQSASASEIFDLDKFARYFALVDLLRAYHSRAWHNQRFYYNPVLCKLEPIAYDGFGEEFSLYTGINSNYIYRILHNRDLHENEYDLVSNIFHDEELATKYLSYLKQYISNEFIDKQLSVLSKDIEYYDSLVKIEFPNENFDANYLYTSAEDIKSYLPELENFLSNYYGNGELGSFVDTTNYTEEIVYENTPEYFVNAYLDSKNGDSLIIEVYNYYPKNIKLLGTGYGDKLIDFYLPKGKNLNAFKFGNEVLSFRSDTMANYIFFVADGSEEIFSKEISKWPYPKGESPQQELLREVNLNDTSIIFKVDGDNLYIKKGEIELSKPLVIPKGYIVNIEAGTKINLIDSAFILSYSAFNFEGNKSNNIVFTSSDFSARGITVLQADRPSVLNYVRLENLNTFNYKGWGLTGALSFYESNVDLDNVVFYRNQCEDALNIVRSDFNLKNSSFDYIFSDAFDSDFSSGIVDNVKFTNIGNDAIDFSGSKILIQNTTVNGAEDKGISGGEDSHLEVRNCFIQNANIGIASKDLSEVKVFDSEIHDCNYGLVLLQKKPEYGPAKIMLKKVIIYNAKTDKLIETGSVVVDNGMTTYGTEKNVAGKFY